mmetsp:Transcript_2947/g.5983  ORF Transcript_2947/g.5983 Transcript_2947/m.5983 type:complete len:202 (+) Transcript_2947:347-952(+)
MFISSAKTTCCHLSRCTVLEALLGELFLGLPHNPSIFIRLLNVLLLLGKHNLHVARAGHVSVDTTVRAVRPTASVLRLVNLDVSNVKVLLVQGLDLSVALSVGQDVQKVPHGLLGKPARSIMVVQLAQVGASCRATEAAERDHILLLQNLVKIIAGAIQLHPLDRHSSLPHVLERGAEIGGTGLGRLNGVLRLTRVLYHGN